MTKPKRHHFVPKAYLENFKNPVDGFLYVYDKISESYRKQRPSQVFVRNKYYQQSWVPAGIDENIFEKKLGSEFEPKGFNSLQKMIDQPTTLTDDDTENIINFIQLQRLRVPRQAEIAKGLAMERNILMNRLKEAEEKLKNFEGENKKSENVKETSEEVKNKQEKTKKKE